jgi:hypothetical protein
MSGYFDACGSYNKEAIVDFRSIGTRKMTEDSKRSRKLKTKLIEGFNTIPFFPSLIANENTLSAFDLNSIETKTFEASLDVSNKSANNQGSNISNSHETDTKQIMKIANININRKTNEYKHEFNYADLYDNQPNLYSKLDSNNKSDNKRLYTRRRYSKAQPDPVYYYDTVNQ